MGKLRGRRLEFGFELVIDANTLVLMLQTRISGSLQSFYTNITRASDQWKQKTFTSRRQESVSL